jgi:PilZ domain
MAQPQMQPEKRGTRRFSFSLPVMVKRLDGRQRELEGITRDVSSRGAFVYLSSEAVEGAAIEFVMTLPADITLAEPIRVLCSGKVLRVERSAHKQGIAVAIEKYDFIGEGQAAS